jgi:ATP-GRASP peptide maturase of grasp-with-spasm system
MIVIFSNSFEPSTNAVIEWLMYFKKPFIRINPDDGTMTSLKLSHQRLAKGTNQTDFQFNYKQFTVSLKDVEAYWFRRGDIPPYKRQFNLANAFKKRFQKLFYGQLTEEMGALNDYLFHLFRKVPRRLGDPKYACVNKMIVLDIAAGLGLATPNSYIVSKKKHVESIMNDDGKAVVTKPIVGLMLQGTSERYFCYTEELTPQQLSDIPDELFPSLLQEKIEKIFEVRSFYLDGRFYSMAIFSQVDKQTQVDFRKYNTETPNRTVPFNIPPEIEEKLTRLMKELNLETGSIDLIVTPEKEYVFLEVNPVGQFGMVSNPCNYHLEKTIAEYLAAK